MSTFEDYRSYLFAIAYRMLGSVMEAEDMVQETYLRWQQTDTQVIDTPRGYLRQIVVRLCLDHLKSARMQREQYIGQWLPEPMLAAPNSPDPVERAESISMAFLVLLETLSPNERAVFILREVFNYDYDNIARTLDKTPAACRQLFSRARRHIDQHRPRYPSDEKTHALLVQRFLQATRQGNLEDLEALLAQDVELHSDGGGKVTAATRPVQGRSNVTRFLLGISRFVTPQHTFSIEIVNGLPGIIVREPSGAVMSVCTLDTDSNHVKQVRIVLNPDKLQHLSEG